MHPNSSMLLPPNVSALDAARYLASLVSDQEKIEPITDTIDEVAEKPGFTKELSPEDNDRLRLICWQLATYLVSEEKVRSFTIDDLEHRIEQRFAGTDATRKLRRMLIAILALTAAAGIVALQVQPPKLQATSSLVEFSALLTIPTMFAVLSLGAAWLFYSALHYFQSNLKRAYGVTVAGVILLGLTHLQFPVLAYTQNLRGPWISDGAIGFTYIAVHVLFLIGAIIFARTLGVRSWLAWWPILVAASAVGSIGVVFAPHSPAIWSEPFFDIATSTFVVGSIASLGAAVLCYRTSLKINKIYQLPMRWLGHASLLLGIAVAQILFVRLLFGYNNIWTDYGLIFVPYLLASVALLRAGYTFNRASNY